VGLVQTVLPFATFLAWRRLAGLSDSSATPRGSGPWVAAALGFAVMLAIALPWPLTVWRHYPDILDAWRKEVTREGATQLAPDPWYTYLVFPVWVLPWLSFFVAGVWVACVSLVRPFDERSGTSPDALRRREGYVLALLLVLVPLLVMTCVKDKNERYMLPMIVPAAVLAAGAAADWFRSDRRDPAGRVVEALHWLTLVIMSLGVPAAGLVAPRVELGAPWFSMPVALAIAAVALLVLFAGTRLFRGTVAAAVTTAAVVLFLQYPIMRWYSRTSTSDLKPLADAVWERYPDAVLYEYEPGTRTRTYLDLPIYAGRLSRKVNEPALLPQGDRPVVVVFFQRRSEGAGELPPPWQELATGGSRKDHWRAYVLPAK